MLEKKAALGNVIAYDVPWEVWVEKYAEDHTEWFEGMVIKLSPVTEDHDGLSRFFVILLEFFLSETGLGMMRTAPFVMKIKPGAPGREPDMQVVLKERAEIVHDTMVAGAADIVIEIASHESMERDYETTYTEYEAAGVREYWLLDPIFKKPTFYRLDENGKYQLIELKDGIFRSTLLPRFQLDTRLLWQKPLPTGKQIAAMVEAMLKKDA